MATDRYRRLVLPAVLAAVAFGPAAAPAPATRPEPPAPGRPGGDPRPARTEWQWRELAGTLDRHVEAVAFSPDGSLVAAGGGDVIRVWDFDTGRPVTRMALPAPQLYVRLAFSADGKTLVSDGREDPCVRFWDVTTGRQLRELPHARGADAPKEFSSPFKALGPGAAVMIDDVRAGWEGYDLRVVDLATGAARGTVRHGLPDHDHWAEAAFAPDGKTFAYNGPAARLRIFTAAGAALVRELRPADEGANRRSAYRSFVRYSPDGRYLLAQEHTGRVETFDVYRFVVWGVADGRRHWASEAAGGWVGAGNRYLVGDDKTVHDLLTDRPVPIANPAPPGRRLAGMSADGGVLAFVGPAGDARRGDGRALAVYLTPAPVLPEPDRYAGRALPPAALADFWAGACGDNLFRRGLAAGVLAAHPDQAVGHAAEVLPPVPAAEGGRVRGLVAELDDADPDVRDRAAADLRRVGHRFEPVLAAALAAPPGEVRNRLTAVTTKLREAGTPADLAADLRGVEFLADLGTPAARRHLAAVAGGAAGNRLTDAAAAALRRPAPPGR